MAHLAKTVYDSYLFSPPQMNSVTSHQVHIYEHYEQFPIAYIYEYKHTEHTPFSKKKLDTLNVIRNSALKITASRCREKPSTKNITTIIATL